MASSVRIAEHWGGAETVPFSQVPGSAESCRAVLEGALLYVHPGQVWQGRENKYSHELLSARLRAEGIMWLISLILPLPCELHHYFAYLTDEAQKEWRIWPDLIAHQ